ncbi:hypothetical protein CANARDRAFT_199870 [[Candida] arabinofermentans NRRL YB-2248]|uniref:protein-tyrosine-phosphatase n=1 Tax=[Candida] arabinofermentans NRRL YB-2248 TaxID=983967 RepID=A0A1E4SZH4_9ASCO|nr:hypothetical protein CANARDRAFT_199870 [[Candida] arabinofermentans NRRL YB-2248]
MSFTIANLKMIDPSALKAKLTSSVVQSPIIIDVRDSDHIGGHIRNSHHIPSTTIPNQCPKIYDLLKDSQTNEVVFHCALSQQRGPSSAMRFIRWLGDNKNDDPFAKSLEIYVLRGGFVKWQELYGSDTEVTDRYDKDLWKFGY